MSQLTQLFQTIGLAAALVAALLALFVPILLLFNSWRRADLYGEPWTGGRISAALVLMLIEGIVIGVLVGGSIIKGNF